MASPNTGADATKRWSSPVAMEQEPSSKRHKLGVVSGVYIPVCLNILSILMFLRFGHILGQVGLLGMLGMTIFAALMK